MANAPSVFKVGTTAKPLEMGDTASSCPWELRVRSKAASGSNYAARFTQKMMGTGSAAAVRAYAYAWGAKAGSVYGVESTAEIHSTASSDISGELCAFKGTATVSLSTSGTVNAMNLTINCASGKTMHANSAFICVANAGSGTDIGNLFYFTDAIGTKSDTTMVTTRHADATAGYAVRVNAAGTTLWLLATSDTPSD